MKKAADGNPQFPMSDLIYHTGALGDFITTIPAIRFHKKQTLNNHLTLLGKPAMGNFALDTGLVDVWLDADSREFLPLFYDVFSRETRLLLPQWRALRRRVFQKGPEQKPRQYKDCNRRTSPCRARRPTHR